MIQENTSFSGNFLATKQKHHTLQNALKKIQLLAKIQRPFKIKRRKNMKQEPKKHYLMNYDRDTQRKKKKKKHHQS